MRFLENYSRPRNPEIDDIHTGSEYTSDNRVLNLITRREFDEKQRLKAFQAQLKTDERRNNIRSTIEGIMAVHEGDLIEALTAMFDELLPR